MVVLGDSGVLRFVRTKGMAMNRLRCWLSRQFFRLGAILDPDDTVFVAVIPNGRDGDRVIEIQAGCMLLGVPLDAEQSDEIAHGLTMEQWEIDALGLARNQE